MRKRSKAARLGVLALAMSLVTVCLLGGTMAKYVTEKTVNATADVAAWTFKITDGKNEITQGIDLRETATETYAGENLAAKVIAPGTKGEFNIVLNAEGTEVGIDYTFEIAKSSSSGNLPENLKFTVDGNTYTLGAATLKGKFEANAASKIKTYLVKWEWPFNSATDLAYDDNDTKAQDEKIDLEIKVTGTQDALDATVSP